MKTGKKVTIDAEGAKRIRETLEEEMARRGGARAARTAKASEPNDKAAIAFELREKYLNELWAEICELVHSEAQNGNFMGRGEIIHRLKKQEKRHEEIGCVIDDAIDIGALRSRRDGTLEMGLLRAGAK
jgi:hypothetical protein